MMVMHLYNGRNTPDEQLDDWGFDGPHLLVQWVHITYLTTLWVRPRGHTNEQLLDTSDDLIGYNGKYYGDVEFYSLVDPDIDPRDNAKYENFLYQKARWSGISTLSFPNQETPQKNEQQADAKSAVEKAARVLMDEVERLLR